MVHRNFEQTEDMVNNLLEMNAKLATIEQLLEADRQEVVGPAPNLLVIHYLLNQLESFRNQTMHQAKKASLDSRNILARWFEQLNTVIEQFNEYITQLAENVLNIVRAGYPDVVVRLIKIAEIEGREDEKVRVFHLIRVTTLLIFRQAIAIRLVKKAAKMDAASKFKSMQANARVIKHYRSKIMRAITDSVAHKFQAAWEKNKEDPVNFLNTLQWMYQDIIRIQSDVVPCFPPDYDIEAHFIKAYHKSLNATIKDMVASEPGASVLLSLFDWLKSYKADMKDLGIRPELLEPPLLDGKEQSLIEDYLNVIIKKLDEWSANLMKTEVEEFSARRDPPEVDADGLYGTQGGAGILFQMVNQQIDLAMDSGQGAILSRVVHETNRVMRSLQEQWVKVIEAEYKKQISNPEEVAPGLVEYIIALANDQIKSADYTEILLARLEPAVNEKYRVPINERLNDAIDGYLDVAKKCTQTLIDIIFNDLKPATKNLFQPPWYDGIMRQIVETMRDYMTDYQTYLNPSLLELLIEDLLDAYLLIYLNGLANAGKLRMPEATDQVRDDVRIAFQFFSTLKPAKELEDYFDVVEKILALLEASRDMAFLSFWEFARIHGPNIAFVESLMKSRGDLDRSAVGEVMDSIKRKVKEEGLTDRTLFHCVCIEVGLTFSKAPEPTIMKKVAVQNSFSRFLNR